MKIFKYNPEQKCSINKMYKILGYDKDNDVYVEYWKGKDLKLAKEIASVLGKITKMDALVRYYPEENIGEPIDWIEIVDEDDKRICLA